MKLTTGCTLLIAVLQTSLATEITVVSPDTRLNATLDVSENISLRVSDAATSLFTISSVTFAVRGEKPFGMRSVIMRTERMSMDTVIAPQVREKRALLHERYNQATVTFSGGYGIVLRVFTEGVAYRLFTSLPGDIVVDRESFEMKLPDSARVTYQYNKEFWSSYENPYRTSTVREIPPEGFCNLPLLADLQNGRKILMTEANIHEYPGLWMKHGGEKNFQAAFPGYPLEFLEGENMYTRGKVTKYAEEIARTKGTRSYPWRVFAVARQDADLLTNSLVYLLGEPSRLSDVSWIKPGLVILDWWARRNLFGVDFPGGVNTATANHLIDFAARYGLEYMLLDCGWTKESDLLKISPDINMEEILAHAKSRNVRILLWAVWSTLERQWDAAFAQFSRWGISGIKVDFMNRDDQLMVDYYYRVAEETARRKMLAIFHGAYKPDGLRRTFPNVITREGLIEFEQNAVNTDDSPEYHTILPFIRMVAGPADYLPGTINNAQKHEFRMVVPRPMGQGTRAHTMALCVVLESPMRMFPDAPPDYYREDTCMRFMAEIPVEWDDIRVLHAKVGDLVVVARRAGDEWFVGAITDWDARDLEIDCSFLDSGRLYTLSAIQDGINADQRAVDFKSTRTTMEKNSRFPIHLAPGGGWVGRFSLKK
jgi:alpha-glucosidase